MFFVYVFLKMTPAKQQKTPLLQQKGKRKGLHV